MKPSLFLNIFVLLALWLNGIVAFGQLEVITIDFENDLIPEGITIDEANSKLYLSSIYKRKLVAHDLISQHTQNFISSGEYGYKSGVGITIWNGKLFALGSDLIEGNWSSVLLVFDLNNKELLHTYHLDLTSSHLMNDLAIDQNGEVYITDTVNHCVYRLQYPDGTIEPFYAHELLQNPNGIAISDDGKKLFVDSWPNGVRVIDLKTKAMGNGKNEKTKGIDGLKYYKGDLYGIRNAGNDTSKHGLVKMVLDESEEKITKVVPLLMDHELMDIPTTFAIANGKAYILANSQLLNLDQETKTIISPQKLKPTYILAFPL